MSTPAELVVKESLGRGRGVFAGRDFAEDEVIEVCPVIVVPGDQQRPIELTILGHYIFNWRRKSAPFPPDQVAIGVFLGYGGLYNHSPAANAAWENDVDENVVHFFALRPIATGEEIMINYGRGAYRPGSVDAPPWWSSYRLRNSALAMGCAVVGLGIAGLRRRHARRSSAVT